MKRGIITLITASILATFLLFYLTHYSNSGAFSSKLSIDEQIKMESGVIQLSVKQLLEGSKFSVNKDDIVMFSLEDETYSFIISEINSKEKRIGIILDKKVLIKIKALEVEKLNLDGDEYYELSIYVDSVNHQSATISFKKINEKIGMIQQIDSRIETLIYEFEENYKLQLNFIIIAVIAMLFAMIAYLVKIYFLPQMKLKKRTEKESPSEILDYLLKNAEQAKLKNNIPKIKKLNKKIKNLYNYLPSSKKQRFQKRIKNLENYLSKCEFSKR